MRAIVSAAVQPEDHEPNDQNNASYHEAENSESEDQNRDTMIATVGISRTFRVRHCSPCIHCHPASGSLRRVERSAIGCGSGSRSSGRFPAPCFTGGRGTASTAAGAL